MSDPVGPQFPGNSRKSREEMEKKEIIPQPQADGATDGDASARKVVKVISGSVVKKKKNWLDKLAGTFFDGDDSKTVIRYIIWDILIPAAKNTVVEMVSSGVEMLFYGEPKSDRIRRDRGRSLFNYNSISSGSLRDRGRGLPERPEVLRHRTAYKFEDITLDRKSDAEQVLENLVDSIETYGAVNVAELYDLVGIPSEYTDNKYGWDNLSRATIERSRYGYTLVLPDPIPLN